MPIETEEQSKIESMKDFALKLLDFHSGQDSALYSVGSCMLAGDDCWVEAVDAAAKELRKFARDNQYKGGLTTHNEDAREASLLARQLVAHRDHKLRLDNLSDFVLGYLECMCFVTDDDAGSGEYGDTGRTLPLVETLSPADLTAIIKDCDAFQKKGESLLDEAYNRDGYNETRAGHDFLFSRNRHGVGYWDRDELDEGGLGRKLTDLAHSFGETWPSIENGKLYI